MSSKALILPDELLENSKLLEIILENIPFGLIVFDESLQHVASNKRLRDILALPDALFDAQRLAQARTRPGQTETHERVRIGDRLVDLRVKHLPNGWQIQTYHDVTQEKSADSLVQASEERLKLALEATGLGLWEYLAAKDEVYLSPSWQQILGYPPEPRWVPSAYLTTLAVHNGSEPFRAALVDLLKGVSNHFCVEHEAVKASGVTIWLQTEAEVAERDPKGRALRVVGTTKNITERKREQSALQAAVEAATSANRAKAEFLATMSHEIRTPLNGVIGLARVLEESELPPREAGYVRMVNSCAKTLLGMVNDVLDFSKIEAGQMVLEPADCDLHALIEETGDVFAARARAKSVTFTARIEYDVPRWVSVDAHRLRQILMNLLGNALKFTTQGNFKLTVASGRLARDRSLRFEVSDTGIGISPQDQSKLFQRFSQVDASSTRRFQGSGLGLAISRDLAELMGGDIRVSSTVGSGSTFTLEIPLVPATAGERTHAPATPAPSQAPAAILVVEDNPINQLVAKALLGKLGFSDVTLAENGAEAVRLCAEQAFSLVLMDCQMPVMDGFEATRQLRESGFERPIVALTAGAVSDDRARCLACGMNDYLAKPIDATMLAGALNFWLASAALDTPRLR